MTVHLLKMAVGAEDVDHIARLQEGRRVEAAARGDPPVARHLTRNTPRRADEVLDGGCMYWVIKGFIQVRQRIVGIDSLAGPDGIPRCALFLDDALVRVVPRRHRAFQGWRYLPAADAPPDLAGPSSGVEDLPPQLAEELRTLGLL